MGAGTQLSLISHSCPKLRCEVAACSACCQPETAPSALQPLRHRMSQEVIGGRRLPPLFGAVAAEHGDESQVPESPERRAAPQRGRVAAYRPTPAASTGLIRVQADGTVVLSSWTANPATPQSRRRPSRTQGHDFRREGRPAAAGNGLDGKPPLQVFADSGARPHPSLLGQRREAASESSVRAPRGALESRFGGFATTAAPWTGDRGQGPGETGPGPAGASDHRSGPEVPY